MNKEIKLQAHTSNMHKLLQKHNWYLLVQLGRVWFREGLGGQSASNKT